MKLPRQLETGPGPRHGDASGHHGPALYNLREKHSVRGIFGACDKLSNLSHDPKHFNNRATGNTGGQVKTWHLSSAVPPALYITALGDTQGGLDLPRNFLKPTQAHLDGKLRRRR